MSVYMIKLNDGRYCVYSTTEMNKNNYYTEEEAIIAFEQNRTFYPGNQYVLNLQTNQLTTSYNHKWGTICYELYTNLIDYEYF